MAVDCLFSVVFFFLVSQKITKYFELIYATLVKVSMFKTLLEYRASLQITSQRYLECLDEMIKGLGMHEDFDNNEINLKYTEAYETAYKPFMKQHEFLLENYLVNYVLKKLFPFDKKTMTGSFTMLVLNFWQIKLHLIGMAIYHKGLTTDLVENCSNPIQKLLTIIQLIYTLWKICYMIKGILLWHIWLFRRRINKLW